jgi:hypothetical protein
MLLWKAITSDTPPVCRFPGFGSIGGSLPIDYEFDRPLSDISKGFP